MDSIGQTFKSARERKRISLSYAASKTRIKLQNLELMERDDFTKMPAPAYAKGFIRMYAEFLGLDAGPLVQHYVTHHQGRRPAAAPAPAAPPSRPPPAVVEPAPAAPEAPEEPAAPAVPLRERLKTWSAAVFTPLLLRRAGAVVLVVLLAWALVTGVSRCARRVARPEPAGGGLIFKKGVPSVIQEPPEPYLELPAAKESTP